MYAPVCSSVDGPHPGGGWSPGRALPETLKSMMALFTTDPTKLSPEPRQAPHLAHSRARTETCGLTGYPIGSFRSHFTGSILVGSPSVRTDTGTLPLPQTATAQPLPPARHSAHAWQPTGPKSQVHYTAR